MSDCKKCDRCGVHRCDRPASDAASWRTYSLPNVAGKSVSHDLCGLCDVELIRFVRLGAAVPLGERARPNSGTPVVVKP